MFGTLKAVANSLLVGGLARLGSGRTPMASGAEMPRLPTGTTLDDLLPGPRQTECFRLHVVEGEIQVDYDLPWEEAIHLGAPNAGFTKIRRVGDQYSKRNGVSLAKITFVNFPGEVTPEFVRGFGQERQLGSTLDPRVIFAIGQYRPGLKSDLSPSTDTMQIVSLETFEIGGGEKYLPCLRWFGRCRSVYGLPLGAKLGPDCWFGFAK